MRSLTYATWPSYPLVFLVPSLQMNDIRREYLDAFDIPTDDVKCLPLHFTGKKTSVGEMKRFINEGLLPELDGAKYLVVADANYFKVLTNHPSAEANLGYVRDCVFGPWKVVYVPSTRSIFYDPPKTRAKIAQGMQALVAHIGGTYVPPGDGIIHFEAYPQTDEEISEWLEKLLEMNRPLTVDIEAFDLKHHKAGIGTITFCWSKHEGIAFPVDYVPITFNECCGGNDQRDCHTEDCYQYPGKPVDKAPFGKQVRNEHRRELLRSFFRRYLQKAIYHNISYDVTVLIYQLFMRDLLDTEGLLEGMDILLRNWDDTQHIIYLATNSCAGNELDLKSNAHEFAGAYMVDVTDITLQPLDKLLRYNLIDGLATWYVHEKYWDRMVADHQLDIYQSLFQPSTLDIIQAHLTGLPLDMAQVKWVKQVLEAIEVDALKRLRETKVVQQFTYLLKEQHVIERNAKLKKKRITLSDPEVEKVVFNPASSEQLQELLYKMLSFPVIDLTDSKLPATGGKTLEKLQNHTSDPDVKEFLQALIDYKSVAKILEAFIPAFESAAMGPDGWYYLFGSFKLGGTKSGRLSSSNPNLQNLPANVEMLISAVFLTLFPELKKFVKKGKLNLGKLIKSCIVAPPGWVFTGLDFASLEDRISALTTKDPNKLKVYTDGYDGHSMRAFAYFGDEMPDIVDTVESINSIAVLYKTQRQDSKEPTFAMTYQGTEATLQKNCGFSEQKAHKVFTKYHELYVVSDQWVQDKLNQAAKDGHITAAFGLRIRTPLLAQTIRGLRKTPYEAEAEGRTAGNALGQSWCLLTNRASVEFMTKVRASEHRLDIKPSAFIHDALYHLVREDVSTILYANRHLRKAVQWQEHPEIAHDEVHLDGAFSIFWPDWSFEIELPEEADENALYQALSQKLERVNEI